MLKVRLLQFFLIIVAIWFVFWSHIYNMLFWNKSFIETISSSTLNIILYSISIFTVIGIELLIRRTHYIAQPRISYSVNNNYSKKNKVMIKKMRKTSNPSIKKIGLFLSISGIILVLISILTVSTILVFIGLSFVFWGIFFPVSIAGKSKISNVLVTTASSEYKTIDRMIDDMHFTGLPIYVPPYLKENYLPESLKGLKDPVLFVGSKESTVLPPIEEIAKNRFLVNNPEGLCVVPPGSGLVLLFENELGDEFTTKNQASFYNALPLIIVNALGVASNLKISAENELVHVTVTDSVFSNLYSLEQNLKSITSIGCPLISAITCVLAKTKGKCVLLSKLEVSKDLKCIDVWYKILEG